MVVVVVVDVFTVFSWRYFPHEHARSRAYRWGEDGLLGITDRQCRVCLALALWNEKDYILKERLFGLTGHQVMMTLTPLPTPSVSPTVIRLLVSKTLMLALSRRLSSRIFKRFLLLLFFAWFVIVVQVGILWCTVAVGDNLHLTLLSHPFSMTFT